MKQDFRPRLKRKWFIGLSDLIEEGFSEGKITRRKYFQCWREKAGEMRKNRARFDGGHSAMVCLCYLYETYAGRCAFNVEQYCRFCEQNFVTIVAAFFSWHFDHYLHFTSFGNKNFTESRAARQWMCRRVLFLSNRRVK